MAEGGVKRKIHGNTIPQSAALTAPFAQGSLWRESILLYSNTIPQSAVLTAPFTQGSLWRESVLLYSNTIPQSAMLTAPFTQGSLWRESILRLLFIQILLIDKAYFEPRRRGGVLFTIKAQMPDKTEG